MNNVKVSANDSYHNYLIKSLQDPEEAAAYLAAILEEEDPEPELLKVALIDVVEASSKTRPSISQEELQRQKLDEVLSQQGSDVIYGLSRWLKDLGLKLTVAVEEVQQ